MKLKCFKITEAITTVKVYFLFLENWRECVLEME